MPTIPFECPSCGSRGAVGAEFIGREARCKHCKHQFVIRDPDDTTVDSYALDEPETGRREEVFHSPAPEAGSVFVSNRGDVAATSPTTHRSKRPKGASGSSARDQAASSGTAWLFQIGIAALLIVVAIALFAPNGTHYAGLILLALGGLMVLVGYWVGAYAAFCEDFLYFFLYVAIPLYTAYYIITRWEDLWPWFACSTVGTGFVLLGTAMVQAAL